MNAGLILAVGCEQKFGILERTRAVGCAEVEAGEVKGSERSYCILHIRVHKSMQKCAVRVACPMELPSRQARI